MLVPASSTVTNRLLHIINNAKIPVVILEALAILVFLMIAIVEAIISDGRKRKGLPEAVETEEKKKEEPKAENKSSKK